MADLPVHSAKRSVRAVLFIASTYVYFLIFAQFGFLKRLGELHITEASLTPVMASMAAGGIAASLCSHRLLRRWSVRTRVRAGFLGCALNALLSLLRLNAWGAGFLAAGIGVSLGLLTVTLVAHLRGWVGSREPLVTVAFGTGLGYFICNVPWLFAGTTSRTAIVGAAGCALAGLFVDEPSSSDITDGLAGRNYAAPPFLSVLLGFTALIWLDSAAFYIIQNSPSLKAGTWGGTPHLWANGVIHLVAALGSAWLLRRRGLVTVMLAAFALIGSACMLLHTASQTLLASLLYPAGVSLYSVALVAYPSLLLRDASSADRAWRAGLIYAIAGWWGSAMGIGMGQHLHRVPTPFVVLTAIALSASAGWRFILRNRAPVAAATGVMLLAALLQRALLRPAVSATVTADTPAARGRQVYIAEGCIHCHSQYVRPRDVDDVTMWGPGSDVEVVRRQKPPLIGNRRQGPDLSEVGGRRSPLWLRIHFMDPRDVSYRSIMPSYAYLFADSRGEDLLAYIESLRAPDDTAHMRHMLTTWAPADTAEREGGGRLFTAYCATCHLTGGRARAKWGAAFRQLPPDLFSAPLPLLSPWGSAQQQVLQLERIIKFGIPGTDMPGHEYLPDADVTSLARWIMQMRGPSSHKG